MAEKWGQIIHILEREDREFKKSMKGQVGTTSSSPNSSDKMESLNKCLLGLVLSPSVQQKRERPKY